MLKEKRITLLESNQKKGSGNMVYTHAPNMRAEEGGAIGILRDFAELIKNFEWKCYNQNCLRLAW